MKTGIWQGRFQYVHNGHYYVFKHELPKYDQKMLAIVNPNPSIPACSNFSRFNDDRNPFTYFQRMLLWKKIADNENLDVMIVPCWHARFKVALENDFLPSRLGRFWIVPLLQDDAEIDKAHDLERQGKKVFAADFEQEDPEYARISATMIRRSIERGEDSYQKYIPSCIWDLTSNLFKGYDVNTYYLIPFIDDKVDILSILHAINIVNCNPKHNYVLFAITVHVSNGELEWVDEKSLPWWFKKARHPNASKTYYKRAKILMELMEKIGTKNYLITPIFVMHEDIDFLSDYNTAFLPHPDNMYAIINETLVKSNYYRYNYKEWLDNVDVENLYITLPNSQDVSDLISNFFSTEYRSYLPIQSDDALRMEIIVLLDETSNNVRQLIDEPISDARTNLNHGGLRDSEVVSLNMLIEDIYPNIRYRYLKEFLRISKCFESCSNNQLKGIHRELLELLNMLKRELKQEAVL